MIAQKFLTVLLIVFALVFLGLQAFGLELEAAGIRALLLILLIALYCTKAKRNLFFLLFLITFASAEILNFLTWINALSDNIMDYFYYIGNLLYILSYLFLIFRILGSMELKTVFKNYFLHILILLVLDVLSVVVVTNTVMDILPHNAYYLEFVYNAVIMVLLNVALINYIYKDDRRSFSLLIGSVFIFFSEMIQLAYFYISATTLLNVICSLFLVFAFVFIYLHSTLANRERTDSLFSDLLA